MQWEHMTAIEFASAARETGVCVKLNLEFFARTSALRDSAKNAGEVGQ